MDLGETCDTVQVRINTLGFAHVAHNTDVYPNEVYMYDTVHFQNIPIFTGIRYNQWADRLANHAAALEDEYQ